MRRTAMAAIAASGLALTAATAEETPTLQYTPADSTFSIIAVGKDTGLLGLGVQSKVLSIGNRVVTGKGGIAIVAHQSASNPMYGKLIIDGIERGMTPESGARVKALLLTFVFAALRPSSCFSSRRQRSR